MIVFVFLQERAFFSHRYASENRFVPPFFGFLRVIALKTPGRSTFSHSSRKLTRDLLRNKSGGKNLNLIRIGIEDARKLWQMQTEAFQDLYKKYQDTENSPAAENIDKTIMRLQQPFTYYYFIQEFDENVGAVRVVDKGEKDTAKRISPIFVLPQYQRLGIAQKAIRMVEALHGSSNWELSTILQEKVNCRLYEKMGYRQTGKTEVITDKMTLVFYKKD